MVSTYHNHQARTQMERPQPPQVDAYTQTYLPGTGKAAQTLSCKELQNLEFL